MYFSESDDDDDISLEMSGSDTSFDDFSSSEENDDSTAPTVAIGPDLVGWTKLSNETATAKKFVAKAATNAMIVMLEYV